MFTGIVEEQGTLLQISRTADSAQVTVSSSITLQNIRRGDSILVSGVCLTIVDFTMDEFIADVMAQTLNVTTLGTAEAGRSINLERAAKFGDRIGGHIMQGHVDGTARVLTITPGSAWQVVRFSLSDELAPLLAAKGSIAVDGVSLTVSNLGGEPGSAWFEVSLIPETLSVTTLGQLELNTVVNLETDILARQLLRITEWGQKL